MIYLCLIFILIWGYNVIVSIPVYLVRTALRNYLIDNLVENLVPSFTEAVQYFIPSDRGITQTDIIGNFKPDIKGRTVQVHIPSGRIWKRTNDASYWNYNVNVELDLPQAAGGEPEAYDLIGSLYCDIMTDLYNNEVGLGFQPTNALGEYILPGNMQFVDLHCSETYNMIGRDTAGQINYWRYVAILTAKISIPIVRKGQLGV